MFSLLLSTFAMMGLTFVIGFFVAGLPLQLIRWLFIVRTRKNWPG